MLNRHKHALNLPAASASASAAAEHTSTGSGSIISNRVIQSNTHMLLSMRASLGGEGIVAEKQTIDRGIRCHTVEACYHSNATLPLYLVSVSTRTRQSKEGDGNKRICF